MVDLVAHHRLALPLLTPSVVQRVWEMYQEETGTTAFPFGPEMVYKATASYVETEETLYAVLHLPLLGKALIYYVQPDIPLILPSGLVSMHQGGGIPGGDGGRLVLPLAGRGGVGFVPRARCHPSLHWRSPEDVLDDGCLPGLYRGEDGAVCQYCQEVSVKVPWVLAGGGGDPLQHRLWTVERLLYMVQCTNGTKQPQDLQSGVHSFEQDRECSIKADTFYLDPWRKSF